MSYSDAASMGVDVVSPLPVITMGPGLFLGAMLGQTALVSEAVEREL